MQYRLVENRTIQLYHAGKPFDASAVLIDDVGLYLGDSESNQTHNGTFTTDARGWAVQGAEVGGGAGE